MPTGTVHFVVPAGIDDPALVSGLRPRNIEDILVC